MKPATGSPVWTSPHFTLQATSTTGWGSDLGEGAEGVKDFLENEFIEGTTVWRVSGVNCERNEHADGGGVYLE